MNLPSKVPSSFKQRIRSPFSELQKWVYFSVFVLSVIPVNSGVDFILTFGDEVIHIF